MSKFCALGNIVKLVESEYLSSIKSISYFSYCNSFELFSVSRAEFLDKGLAWICMPLLYKLLTK